MGVVTKEVIDLVPGLHLVTPTTLIGLPIVTGNHSNILTPPTFIVFIGHLIKIGGDTLDQKVVQDLIHRKENHHQGKNIAIFIIFTYTYHTR